MDSRYMMGLIFKLCLAWHLSRSAYHMGVRHPTMSVLQWWGWIGAGVVIEMILLRISLFGRDPYQRIDWIQLPLVAAGLILIFVLMPAVIAWGVGRLKRAKVPANGPPKESLKRERG